jgi:2-polyprenyl-3-methyl-5-hydroxy-6-metoxy-1,4-benzoquinol methylase
MNPYRGSRDADCLCSKINFKEYCETDMTNNVNAQTRHDNNVIFMGKNSSVFWNHLYKATPLQELTWYEAIPVSSLKVITALDLPLSASIIDVGGGPAILARQLLALGYKDITVLDCFSQAVAKGKQQLGEFASGIEWLNADVRNFEPSRQYDLWHDRGCLHFFPKKEDQLKYVNAAQSLIKKGGKLIVGAFSMQGPRVCGGLEVQRYSRSAMAKLFKDCFDLEDYTERTHITPDSKLEPFVFCTFTRR